MRLQLWHSTKWLMQKFYGIQKVEATALASVSVDFRITGVVNGVKGVHAILPHDAIWK
ncbi:hypothetical protein C8K15_11127 [Paenisporosarcina sp. OV554]|nr:hypothetical protein C8K15_11127 [Paenisporosarcina sp. OV554]